MERIPLRSYLWMNLFFWGFCLAQFLLVRHFLRRLEGISVFFVVLAAGFTGVCIFDAVCGAFFREETSESARAAGDAAEEAAKPEKDMQI